MRDLEAASASGRKEGKASSVGGSSTEPHENGLVSAESAEAVRLTELRRRWDELLAEAASTVDADRQKTLLQQVRTPFAVPA